MFADKIQINQMTMSNFNVLRSGAPGNLKQLSACLFKAMQPGLLLIFLISFQTRQTYNILNSFLQAMH